MAVSCKIGTSLFELVQGDIAEQRVDAIVNAANAELSGGGGVDGAIHRAGGPKIMEACDAIGGCAIGQAVATTAGNLGAKKVLHAVGPIYRDGKQGEAKLLASAYTRALELAVEHGLKSVALPSISTGAYGYPMEDAARIALGIAIDFVGRHQEPDLLRFVLWDSDALETYEMVFSELAPTQGSDGP